MQVAGRTVRAPPFRILGGEEHERLRLKAHVAVGNNDVSIDQPFDDRSFQPIGLDVMVCGHRT
jgi:hypothetical protein